MILRDKGKITKMLILLEILRGRKKLREIAEHIDITVQGVSEYIKILEREGLLKDWELTIAGLEFLNNALDELGDFVSESNAVLKKMQVIEAIAGERIEKGEKVKLVMENGYIHAYRGEGNSTGTAMNSADKGEDVGVTELRGVLEIEYGKVKIYAMPSIEEGGTKKINPRKIEKIIEENKGAKIGVCGVVAYLAVRKIAKIDFQFSAMNAAIDAHYRGISTVLFVSHSMLPHVLKTMEEKGVPYTLEKV